MSVEIHDKLIALLSEVDGFKTKEADLKSEKARHLEQIATSESNVQRCDDELGEVRENQLRLRRAMDGLRDVLFAREDEQAIVEDPANTPNEDGGPEGERHRSWKERQRHLKQVAP
jgi:hypothetical protein